MATINCRAIISVATISLFGIACLTTKGMPQESREEFLERRWPAAGAIAQAFNESVISLDQTPLDRTIVKVDLRPLKLAFPSTRYHAGIITVKDRGHRYDIYLLTNSICIKTSPVDPQILVTEFYKPKRETGWLYECGDYTILMNEDHNLWWQWDLVPAFRQQRLPHQGGSITHLITDDVEGDLKKLTKEALERKCE